MSTRSHVMHGVTPDTAYVVTVNGVEIPASPVTSDEFGILVFAFDDAGRGSPLTVSVQPASSGIDPDDWTPPADEPMEENDRLTVWPPTPNPMRDFLLWQWERPTDAEPAPVWCEVLSVTGRAIKMLRNGWTGAGLDVARWDGTDKQGNRCGASVYFLRLVVGEEEARAKVVKL